MSFSQTRLSKSRFSGTRFLRTRFSRTRTGRTLALATLFAFLPMSTAGCFGEFRLIRKVYDFNQQVDSDKWVRWFVFLVINIIPIYGIAGALDALFANSVEFWTGENPITADVTRTIEGENGEVAIATFRPGGIVDVEVVGPDGISHRLRLVKSEDGVQAMDAEGNPIGRATEIGGRLVFQPAL